MKFIGLLMVSGENDILADTLTQNARWIDGFYALIGGSDTSDAIDICVNTGRCYGYRREEDLTDRYPLPVRDGARQYLYQRAGSDARPDGSPVNSPDDWFLLLHGDELWVDDPRDLPAKYPGADGFMFRLPLYFPREADGWEDAAPPLQQLKWHLGPGWPELRMFQGGPDVHYDPAQHFNVTPAGLRNIVDTGRIIKHYPYRSPKHQVARALRHRETGFDPDNYRHIGEDGTGTLWSDERIRSQHANYSVLGCDA